MYTFYILYTEYDFEFLKHNFFFLFCSPQYLQCLKQSQAKSRCSVEVYGVYYPSNKDCLTTGRGRVDGEVVMLSAHWEKKQASLRDLQQQLQQLPGLIADLESLTASLTHLEASFEEVENHLLNLEDLCGQCELERYKHMQSQQLENYKKNKRELERSSEKLTKRFQNEQGQNKLKINYPIY
ncbi:hypothetical protein FD754_009956 [Muntiacus muntjak]|uniref:Uncharacterized protein n=1 Tax=Muntiacus muntjak TaxID=9888 RepID=A0A5N3WVE4_MUNMU|nr:hypothetical protein FD754_009956 [Muntiacus muntjak]